MGRKLLNPPKRFDRISAHSVRRSLLTNKWFLIPIITLLIVLLIIALLFLQANAATAKLKKINDNNHQDLTSAVDRTTKTINSANVMKKNDTNKVFLELTNLTSTADRISEACATASKPLVADLAKNYNQVNERCEDITKSAREVRDATNGFMPIARYQVELSNALAPVISYQKSEEKTDLPKGIAAWKETRDNLQKVTVPTALKDTNIKLIDTSSEIVEALEKAKVSKDGGDNAAYKASVAEISQRYTVINELSEPIRAELAASQKALTQAAASLE